MVSSRDQNSRHESLMYTLREVAAIGRMSPRTARRHHKGGLLPKGLLIGRKLLFPKEVIDHFFGLDTAAPVGVAS